MSNETLDPEKTVITVLILSLKKFSNEELAAFNLVLNFLDKIPQINLSYKIAYECRFIDANEVIEKDIKTSLIKATEMEVCTRMEAGTF